MDLAFDISQDEMPIFVAESEEHLQVLEEGLVRLENQDYDPELLQALFRAAHTLKGMAGMIGHKRMVELTHALETAFDGVRKEQLAITSPLIDLCLRAVDNLRTLCEEVTSGQFSQIDVNELVQEFLTFTDHGSAPAAQPIPTQPAAVSSNGKGEKPTEPKEEVLEETGKPLTVIADISPKSIASAARAFQVMLAVQNCGEIISMDPTQEKIESAAPVSRFTIEFMPTAPLEQIRKELDLIADIDHLSIQNGKDAKSTPAGATNILPSPTPQATPASGALPTADPPRIGEYLVSSGRITREQLDAALKKQKSYPQNEGPLLGQVLVQSGYISQDAIDHAIAEFIQKQRGTTSANQAEIEKNKAANNVDKTVRTSVERLDSLMNLVGELITDRNRLVQIRNHLGLDYQGNEQIEALSEAVVHIGRITDQLQEEVMHIRMLPVSNVFNKFPRLVRDLSQKTGKQIDLVIRGQDTELDRSVIDEINDPLIHLIRNSIDHGIELPAVREAAGKPARGTVTLTARHEHGRIVLTVSDDGGGIDIGRLKASAIHKGFITEIEAAAMTDEKAIDLIFHSGLSTSEKVTDISGRGVGMDIVRNNIERVNGSIVVESHPGQGTKFEIILPLTLAIVHTLLVRVSGIPCAIPLVMVTETQRLAPSDIQTISNRPVTLLRNHVLPLIYMADVCGFEREGEQSAYLSMVVVRSGKQQVGLIVDKLLGEEDVVVKSLGSVIGEVPGVSSAAILGDGQVALIIDIQSLLKIAGI